MIDSLEHKSKEITSKVNVFEEQATKAALGKIVRL